jgi:TolA-binding protein
VKFIVGAIALLLVSIAAIAAYAAATGQDVPGLVAKARGSVQSIDAEQVGAQVQQGIADAQAQVQESVTKIMAMAGNGAVSAEPEPAASV